jgi:hypothetical protein
LHIIIVLSDVVWATGRVALTPLSLSVHISDIIFPKRPIDLQGFPEGPMVLLGIAFPVYSENESVPFSP